MTKQERHIAYVECLNDIQSGKFAFCCESFVNRKYMHWDSDASSIFIELYNLRTGVVFWFKNYQERIDALKKCIELTK